MKLISLEQWAGFQSQKSYQSNTCVNQENCNNI